MKGLTQRELKQTWQDEAWDSYLPQEGFLTDFVAATRGSESPTQLALWSAIFTVSTLLKRDAYLHWYPSPLYPNMFIVMIAPPRICAKSTIARVADEVLIGFPDYIENLKLKSSKRIPIIRSKATPEGISMMLKPTVSSEINEETQKVLMIERDSHLCIIISELSTLMNKKLYNQGLIGKLTDLYDCKDTDSDVTQGRGEQIFKNIYVTLLGATTIDGLRDAIPEEAFGDGFMSRVILVNQPTSTRSYPTPFNIPEISLNDLQKRAAFIAEHALGEYRMNEEAYEWYKNFYIKYKLNLFGLAKEQNIIGKMIYRYDINLLKLALIIHISTYTTDYEITIQDLKDAKKILEQTYKGNKDLAGDLIVNDNFQKSYRVIAAKIEREQKIKRRKLLQHCSSYSISAQETTRILNQLYQEGLLEVRNTKNIVIHTITTTGEEQYKWLG